MTKEVLRILGSVHVYMAGLKRGISDDNFIRLLHWGHGNAVVFFVVFVNMLKDCTNLLQLNIIKIS